jgi:hypothetical protein
MTSESSDSLYDSVYKSLQEKDTEELLEIWQQNDRNEWSDKAFVAIHEILLERLGSEPPEQGPPPEDEREELLFFDLYKVATLSDNMNIAAWTVLIGYVLIWVGNLYVSGINAQTFIALLYILLQGVVFFFVLRFMAQALILLLGIVENTRG